jgi:hypothetical protein
MFGEQGWISRSKILVLSSWIAAVSEAAASIDHRMEGSGDSSRDVENQPQSTACLQLGFCRFMFHEFRCNMDGGRGGLKGRCTNHIQMQLRVDVLLLLVSHGRNWPIIHPRLPIHFVCE